MRWSIHFSEQQQQKCLIFVTICYSSQNRIYQTKQQTKFAGISVTPSCKELSFRQNDYSVSRGEWRWWYWNCLQILWHFSLEFPPLKYVLGSVTDFSWTESGEPDFCSVGKPTLSISHYAVKKPRPHTEHLVSASNDRSQLMPHVLKKFEGYCIELSRAELINASQKKIVKIRLSLINLINMDSNPVSIFLSYE